VHYYDTTGTYTVKLTASVPWLCTSQDSFVITIHPRPVADFQFSTTCANSPVIFTNLSTVQNDSIVFYKWEFGDGTFSLGTNASHQYLIGGTYQVNCIVITSNGCVDTATQTIQVPKVNFIYQNTCLGETVDFQSDLFYPNDNPTGYQWFINNQFVTNQPNFTYNFPNLGTYPVKLIVQTQNGCLDSVIKNIDIIQRPIANFQVVGKTCVNDTVLFVENSSLSNKPIALRIWDFGDGNVDTTTQKQVYYSYNLPGSYNVTLTIVTTTNCTSSVTLPVIVGTSPVVGFTQQNLYCNTKTFTLIDTSTSDPNDPIVSRYWDLGNGMFSTNDTLIYQYPDTGQQIIGLTVITQSGCSAFIYDTLYFQMQPTADFSFPKDTFLTIENVIPTNLCQNAHSFIWLRSDSTAWSSTDTNPVFQFPEPGTYYITLIALHDSGCVDSIQKPVVVVVPVDTIMDIAVLDLQTNVDSTGIMTVAVKIKNKSTVPVYKATMFVRLGQEIANREYYLGNLAPGAIEEYVFKANIVTNPYEKLTYICVNGILPNDLDDVYPDDNVICKSLNDEFYIQNPYPNPTNQTLVIPYILPDNDIVRIQIINELGQIITVLKDDMGQKGLNFLQTDVSNLSSGTYMIVMEFQGKFLMKKFVKYKN
jgi:PKD repeat protein